MLSAQGSVFGSHQRGGESLHINWFAYLLSTYNFLLHLFVCVGVHKGQRNTLQEPALSFYFVDLVDWWQALLPPEYLLLPLIIFGDGVLSVLSR